MAEIEMVPVASSNLAAVGYDPETSELKIEFRSGAVYSYSGVPADVAAGVVSGGGSYFARHIKNVYPFQQE